MPEPQPHQATPVALMAQAQSEDLVRLPYKRAALLRVLIVDTDFVLVFADGRKVLIRDGAMQATARRGYKIVLQEEELSGDTDLDHTSRTDVVFRRAGATGCCGTAS
jgi:hypothetical protein